MITITKKKKNFKVECEFDNSNSLIEFNQIQLEQISRCNYIEYNIKHSIITNIPSNIKKIVFGSHFNKNIQPFLHPAINLLNFGYEFNLPIDNLPTELKKLILGVKFNQKVDNLPLGLEMIIFAGIFSQPIDMLPHSIKYIYLSGRFNQNIDNLPLGLVKIFLTGYNFSYPIDSLPDSVEIIKLNPIYKTEIKKLPTQLKTIFIDKYVKCQIDLHKLYKLAKNKNIEFV
jgi:hypothetical protein